MRPRRCSHVRGRGWNFPHVLATLVVCALTPHWVQTGPVAGTADVGLQEDKWLVDQSFYGIDYDDEIPQADGRQVSGNDLCPPVPKRLPVGGCDLAQCSSDRECSERQLKCCYNGCVYTCLPEVKPPAYFDWIKEPLRRLQFGQSWLIPGPNQQLDVMSCSTSPVQDDSDPLLCPHGYECSIDEESRSAEGIPNRGHCVKVADEPIPLLSTASPGGIDPASSSKSGATLEEPASHHGCHLEDHVIVLSGHTVSLEGRDCFCQETILICDETTTSPTM